MLTNERKTQIEKITTDLLNRYNYIDDMVDIANIVRQQGYEVFVDDDLENNISGFVDHENKEVVLNANETPERRRFTLAHELGHIILNADSGQIQHRDNITNSQLDIYASEPNEVEANYFAGCILMPRNVFIREFNKIKQDISVKTQLLAYYFGVSQLAVYVRANILNLIGI